jgi:hypothetical protein
MNEEKISVNVFERKGEPGVWSVEAIEFSKDGAIEQTIFIGPNARARAEEYAQFKYQLINELP